MRCPGVADGLGLGDGLRQGVEIRLACVVASVQPPLCGIKVEGKGGRGGALGPCEARTRDGQSKGA